MKELAKDLSILRGNRITFSDTPNEGEIFYLGFYANSPKPSAYYSTNWRKCDYQWFLVRDGVIKSQWDKYKKKEYKAFIKSFK